MAVSESWCFYFVLLSTVITFIPYAACMCPLSTLCCTGMSIRPAVSQGCSSLDVSLYFALDWGLQLSTTHSCVHAYMCVFIHVCSPPLCMCMHLCVCVILLQPGLSSPRTLLKARLPGNKHIRKKTGILRKIKTQNESILKYDCTTNSIVINMNLFKAYHVIVKKKYIIVIIWGYRYFSWQLYNKVWDQVAEAEEAFSHKATVPVMQQNKKINLPQRKPTVEQWYCDWYNLLCAWKFKRKTDRLVHVRGDGGWLWDWPVLCTTLLSRSSVFCRVEALF